MQVAGGVEQKKEESCRDKSEKGNLREIELLVATLIATVTFAAGFTMPGGYNNDGPDEGLVTLNSKAAFQIFLVANTGAMAPSTAAIFTHLNAVMTIFDRSKANWIDRSFNKANFFTAIAIIGMVVHFAYSLIYVIRYYVAASAAPYVVVVVAQKTVILRIRQGRRRSPSLRKVLHHQFN
ncbi:hypothetical protein NE237_028902 [Protea cynaroides]|uniref:PGG domain-containing protein n=1 Tax=Protea cynaroides TaxID=273540 RepID=A0A9Q0JVL0_9MAGN|nr:hypothetical protein NE237_028902 [Protea cynaroides]